MRKVTLLTGVTLLVCTSIPIALAQTTIVCSSRSVSSSGLVSVSQHITSVNGVTTVQTTTNDNGKVTQTSSTTGSSAGAQAMSSAGTVSSSVVSSSVVSSSAVSSSVVTTPRQPAKPGAKPARQNVKTPVVPKVKRASAKTVITARAMLKPTGTSKAKGQATFVYNWRTGKTKVVLVVRGLAPGSSHAAHVHRGSCAGSVVVPLKSVTANRGGVGVSVSEIKGKIDVEKWWVDVHAGATCPSPDITRGKVQKLTAITLFGP